MGNFNFSLFLAFDWLRNQIHCWTITNNNDLFIYFIYYKHFFYHIRQNIFYTVMNAMLISTALFIYFIYYLEMTWKTQINHILSQSQFQTRPFCLWKQLFSYSDSWTFVHIRNFLVRLFCTRAPSGFEYEWTHTACNECLVLRDVHLALFWVRIKHQVMQQTILSLWI